MNIFKRNKMSEIEENIKILDFLIRNKTKETYAFSIGEISKGAGIRNITHSRLLNIENIEYVELYGKIWYTYMGTQEQFQRVLDILIEEGKVKEAIKDGIKTYEAT